MAKHLAKCPKCGNQLTYESAVGDRIQCASCGAVLKAPGKGRPSDPLIGQTLGKFEITGLLGRGGMGAVYKGRQASLNRDVAIKVLPPRLAQDDDFVERFNREARSAAAINHPNIIEVYDIDEAAGHQYIVMEFVDGESLADRLKREGRLKPDVALDILKQVASALEAAHEKNILHRDIKPGNILFTKRGRAKVADFGLAKHEGVDVSVTQTGASLGTPLYMAPEISRGRAPDPRSDLYSLGATFYQAIAGKPPFEGATPTEVIVKHLEGQVPPLQELAPDAPRALCRVIHKLLRKNPGERYESAEELLAALEKVEASPVAPKPAAAPARSKRHPRPHRAHEHAPTHPHPESKAPKKNHLPVVLGGIGALVLVVVVLLLIPRGGEEKPQRNKDRSFFKYYPEKRPPLSSSKKTLTSPRDLREAEAQKLFADAQRTAQPGTWLSAETYLARLDREYAKTDYYVASRADIDALKAKVAARGMPEKAWKPVAADADGWISLFDGKTLRGWKTVEEFETRQGGKYLSGDVRVEGSQLLLERGKVLTGIAADVQWPRSDYEVSVEAMLRDGWQLCNIRFPAGPGTGKLHVTGPRELHLSGLRTPDGETKGRMTFPIPALAKERWYRLRLRVTRARLEFWMDSKKVIDLPQIERQLGPDDGHGDLRPFGIETYMSATAIRSICLRRLKPDGTPVLPVKPEEPAAGPWKVYTKWPFDAAEAKRRQEETAKALGVPVEQDIDLGNGVKLTMVLIPAGEFMMGSPEKPTSEELAKLYDGKAEDYERERPQHRVRITKPFWLGKTEVTQAQWQAIMGTNPSEFPAPAKPVEQVSWDDCQAFLAKLNGRNASKGLRLPTEAEWEYACRAGADTPFCFGSNIRRLDSYAWFAAISDRSTQPVNTRTPNGWRLHDMHGNVWEWTGDWHGPYTADAKTDPAGPATGSERAVRGAGYGGKPGACRSATRGHRDPGSPREDIGFRVAQILPLREAATPSLPTRPTLVVPVPEPAPHLDKAMPPVGTKLAAWDFAGAAELVGGASLPRDILAQKKDEIGRLAKLKAKMIETINAAKPPWKKSHLLLTGMNGDIVNADEAGITAKVGDKTETIAWGDLKSRNVGMLLNRALDRTKADDWIAAGLLSIALGELARAEGYFRQATSLGAKVEPYLGPLAEASFRAATALLEKGDFAKAKTALAAFETKYGKTPWAASHKQSIDAAWARTEGGIVATAPKPKRINTDPKQQLPDPDTKPAAAGKPVKVFILMGSTNMLGFGDIGPGSKSGTLRHLTEGGKHTHLVDDRGSWTQRRDVRLVQVMSANNDMETLRNEWLTVKGKLGPELQFGHIMGHVFDEPVLVLKTCIGNRSLGWDLLPPGSKRFEFGGKIYAGYKDSPQSWDKGTKPQPIAWYAGKQYDSDVASAKKVLADIGKYYPGSRSYEVAGFVWWQGEKDRNPAHASRYEQNLVRLIKTLRKDFNAPKAKFVLATFGTGGWSLSGPGLTIAKAQLAVSGEKGKYSEFKGNVKTVEARGFWRGMIHAETYMDVGNALGWAMAHMLINK